MFQGLKSFGSNLMKRFQEGATEKLKQYGFGDKGEHQKEVEKYEPVDRMWTDQGNLNYYIQKGIVYKMLCSYCLPFLYYKQLLLLNRVCFKLLYY